MLKAQIYQHFNYVILWVLILISLCDILHHGDKMVDETLTSNEALSFIKSFINKNPDNLISDSLFKIELNIDLSFKKDSYKLLATKSSDVITGLYLFYEIKDESYIEGIYLFTNNKYSFKELIKYLKDKYEGYECYFTVHPKSKIILDELKKNNAFFFTEQKSMYHTGVISDPEDKNIILYNDNYKDEYIKIHDTLGYWDGKKMVDKKDDFNIILYVNKNKVLGYIDITKENPFVFDILVKENYRNQKIGHKLLQKALFMANGAKVSLGVDIDNTYAIKLYEGLGFIEDELNHSITSILKLGDKN